MPDALFHPTVARWFRKAFGRATPVQEHAWPAIREHRDTLIAAPTGSGKTLAAFMAAIDDLVREGLAGDLPDETRVLYVSPLKALSNDIQKNLQVPLEGISEELAVDGHPEVAIRAWVRTGDTSSSERDRMRRRPPHIVVTTPESLYILLTSESGRKMLATVRTVIVDEIHALAGSKRGSHLTLSLERLAALCEQPPVRVGISATQKPIEAMAAFLTGHGDRCTIVDTGHNRDRDLALEVPSSPLSAIMANEVWDEVYDRLAELVEAHGTTLIFVNTRRLAERAARFLAERLGEENVTAHHGSLSREHRLTAEQRLKNGELKALVATASLELGIDIGDVDLVCQLGSPRSIAALLQRVGRSGHAVIGTPKGRLFPLSRDDLVECTALLQSVERGELDRIRIPAHPLDVLAQQIVAEVAGREWDEQALYECFTHAWPYRGLTRETFTEVLRMLADGYTTRRGRRGAYLHRDAVHGRLRPRRGARLVAMTNGGAIPDQFDYEVHLVPEGLRIGSLNEDFAFESLPGDIFQLGNTSYRILKIEQGRVFVEDAKGQPPNIPFWFGEAPGRTDELSESVSRLRAEASEQLDRGLEPALDWARTGLSLPEAAAVQLVNYLGAAHVALGALPTQSRIVFERFFDETGDMHLVVHAPFGSRMNRAWGLALRKRFCRKFNFELQAAALEDSIVLSLGSTHSFPLEEVARYLNSHTVRQVLIQALLDAPMFGTRWRWNATISLAVQRNRNGKRVPAQWQRNDAEDLVAVVFPDQLACAENIPGDRQVPDHPLVNQTLADCLDDTMDITALEHFLARLEAGEVQVLSRDLAAPSPLADEILNARPYAFLDDAPAEERRTLAVRSGEVADLADAARLARLDPEAIQRVRDEAWPEARDLDELHDALVLLGFVTDQELQRESGWAAWAEELAETRRATRLVVGKTGIWVAAERLAEAQAALPNAPMAPEIRPVLDGREPPEPADALRELIRSRLEGVGPVTVEVLAAPLSLRAVQVEAALLALEQEGFAMRGTYTGTGQTEWCDRRLLARINRYTLQRKRAEIQPASRQDFMRFLFRWHGLGLERGEGPEALEAALEQLEGFAVPAAAWESAVLPDRVQAYFPSMLDQLCTSGRMTWLRLALPRPRTDGTEAPRGASPVRNTPIALVDRAALPAWQALAGPSGWTEADLSGGGARVYHALNEKGALFFVDLVRETGLLRTQVEDALGELVARGLVTADSYAGLRALIQPSNRRPGFAPKYRPRRRRQGAGVDAAGRWSLVGTDAGEPDYAALEHLAYTLLHRYGVVFRRILEREDVLPSWRELLYVFRRLEARGEIRGGRFVEGFAGEQYALPEAVDALKRVRKAEKDGDYVALSAADPLNLVGIVLPGERVPAVTHNRILFRDGLPVAFQTAGEIRFAEELDPQAQWQVRNLLIRRQDPAVLAPQGRA